MKISNVKKHRLYKNSFGGRIMIRLSLIKSESESVVNMLYEKLCDKYFSSAKSFIESRTDNSTYFLDVICDAAEEGELLKIKRSSALKCGASLIKEYIAYDVFDKEGKRIKKR